MSTVSPFDYAPGSIVVYRNFLDQDVRVMVDRQEYYLGHHGFVGCVMEASENPAEHPIVWGRTDQIHTVERY